MCKEMPLKETERALWALAPVSSPTRPSPPRCCSASAATPLAGLCPATHMHLLHLLGASPSLQASHLTGHWLCRVVDQRRERGQCRRHQSGVLWRKFQP